MYSENNTPIQPKFCRYCGQPWESGLDYCLNCEKQKKKQSKSKSIFPVFALYFLLIFSSIVLLLLDGKLMEQFIVEIIDAVIVLGFALYYRHYFKGMFNIQGQLPWIAFAFIISIGTFLFADFVVGFFVHFIGVEDYKYTPDYFLEDYGWLAIILSICVQPAIFEELSFRGIILPNLQSYMSRFDAIILTTLLFTFVHLSVYSIPHIFLIGFILAYLKLYSKSLWPCIALHFFHNLWVVLGEHYFPDSIFW